MLERVTAYNASSTATDDVFNKEFVDQLQRSFDCCGWEDADDYSELSTRKADFCDFK